MNCPRCGLVRPPQVHLCSCGYDFSTGIVPSPSAPAAQTPHPYVPLTQASRWATTALIIVAAWSCMDIVLDLRGVGPAHWAFQMAMARATRNIALLTRGNAMLLPLAGIALNVGSAVAFLVWFARARRNLPALGIEDCQYEQWWAVGGFLIPVLNLVRPFQVMREIWNASEPDDRSFLTPAQEHYWRQVTPPIVWWWWGLFLASNALANASAPFARFRWVTTLQTATLLSLASHSVRVIAAVVAVVLVRLLSVRQEDRNRARSSRSLQPDAPHAVSEPK
jgi:hypothetical protein